MDLGLGTVQFGLDYGLTNHDGKTGIVEVSKMLKTASNRVLYLDTAPAYGSSEEVLGNLLPENHKFRIVTKTPHFTSNLSIKEKIEMLENALLQSFQKMKQKKFYALLIHNADDLLSADGPSLLKRMNSFKESNLLDKIGVSVYNSGQIDKLLNYTTIDIIQIPISIFDQRLIQSGHLKTIKNKGVEVHARSVFLQGLLLLQPDDIPEYFCKYKKLIKQYHTMIKKMGLTPLQAALGFVNGLEEIDVCLVGATNNIQLQEIIEAALIRLDKDLFSPYAITDVNIINPTNWKIPK